MLTDWRALHIELVGARFAADTVGARRRVQAHLRAGPGVWASALGDKCTNLVLAPAVRSGERARSLMDAIWQAGEHCGWPDAAAETRARQVSRTSAAPTRTSGLVVVSLLHCVYTGGALLFTHCCKRRSRATSRRASQAGTRHDAHTHDTREPTRAGLN